MRQKDSLVCKLWFEKSQGLRKFTGISKAKIQAGADLARRAATSHPLAKGAAAIHSGNHFGRSRAKPSRFGPEASMQKLDEIC